MNTDATAAMSIMPPSILTASRRGNWAGASRGITRTSAHATRTPSSPPAAESDCALGEELTRQAPAAAADRRPDGQFALSRHAA